MRKNPRKFQIFNTQASLDAKHLISFKTLERLSAIEKKVKHGNQHSSYKSNNILNTFQNTKKHKTVAYESEIS